MADAWERLEQRQDKQRVVVGTVALTVASALLLYLIFVAMPEGKRQWEATQLIEPAPTPMEPSGE